MSIREYFWLAVILILGVAFVWDHYRGVADGVAKEKAAEVRAAAAQQKKDEAHAKDTIDSLNADMAKLRELADRPRPPGPVRLLRAACPQPAEPARGTAAEPPAAGSVPDVRAADRSTSDSGPDLRLLANGAEVVAAQLRACQKWARDLTK
jgi:hypothetical protein